MTSDLREDIPRHARAVSAKVSADIPLQNELTSSAQVCNDMGKGGKVTSKS